MSEPTLSAEQRETLAQVILEGWEDEPTAAEEELTATVVKNLAPVVARMIAEAERIGYGRGLTRDYGRGYQRGRAEVTAVVEAVLTDPAVRLDDITEAGAEAVRAALADPAAHVAAIKAEALREAADELAAKGHRSAVTRLRDRADRIGGAQ